MRDFLAEVRYFLSMELERMNIGSIVHQFIRTEIIPELQKKVNAASGKKERAKWMDLIDTYVVYSDPRSQESKIYDRTAASNIRQIASRARMGYEDMEDLAQQLAIDFFKPLAGGSQILMDVIRRFRIEEGPLSLNKLWINIVAQRTKYHIRQLQSHHKEQVFDNMQDDEGDDFDPMTNIPAPSRVDERAVQEVIEELPKYVHSHLNKPALRQMFDKWYEVIQENGVARLDMKNDVYEELRKEGMDIPRSTMYEMWKVIGNVIVNYFRGELDDKYLPQVKKLLRVGSVDALTYVCYRQKLAAWMLGGMLLARLQSED